MIEGAPFKSIHHRREHIHLSTQRRRIRQPAAAEPATSVPVPGVCAAVVRTNCHIWDSPELRVCLWSVCVLLLSWAWLRRYKFFFGLKCRLGEEIH